ncbi:MAG: TMEM175 family protein [Methanolinea sp.]|nr:TMEM175 family protein [Methanolinea sp.]
MAIHEPITKVNLERLTNGVYAFTMTLLVRNIPTPAPNATSTAGQITEYLFTAAIGVVDFIGVFLILGMFWLFVFQMFHRMRTFDFRFLYLHLLSLMVVVFIPFTETFTKYSYEYPIADLLFQVNYLALGVIIAWEWHYARKHPELREPELTTPEAVFLERKFMVPVGVAAFGIALVVLDFQALDLLYVLPFVILFVFFRNPPEGAEGRGE